MSIKENKKAENEQKRASLIRLAEHSLSTDNKEEEFFTSMFGSVQKT